MADLLEPLVTLLLSACDNQDPAAGQAAFLSAVHIFYPKLLESHKGNLLLAALREAQKLPRLRAQQTATDLNANL